MEERSLLPLVLVLFSGILVYGDCPAGWVLHGNKCFYLTQSNYNYAQALQFCSQQQNASLVSFKTQDELNYIKKILDSENTRALFISAMIYNTTSKQWAWGDGTFYNKTLVKWYRNTEPKLSANNIRSHYTCSYYFSYKPYTGQLYYTSCNSVFRVICQRPSDTYDLCNEADGWRDVFGKCFKFFDQKSTWYDARTTCSQNGGLLPTPLSYTELMMFKDFVECKVKGNDIWTAFTDINSPGRYLSIDTNHTMSYQGWYQTAQTPRGQTCVTSSAVGNAYFSKDICINEHKFLCVKPHGTCPSGWVTSGRMCFRLYTDINSRTSWYAANDICQKQITQMLTIEDATSEGNVRNILSRFRISDAWLAFSDAQQDGNYTWVDGTSLNISTSYRHFNRNYPRPVPGKTECGMILSNGLWQNAYCFTSRSFICEMPITQRVVNVTQPVNNVTCPKGWVLFRQDCYYLGPLQTWDASRKLCQAYNSDLTTIRDPLEQSYLTNTMKVPNSWIGLKRDTQTTNNDYYWIDNTPVTYKNWSPGQPQPYDCVVTLYYRHAYQGSWQSVNCASRRNYVCRKPAVGATPGPPTGSTIAWSYRCGPGWVYNAMESSCYLVMIGAKKNWQDARADCRRRSADLMGIDGPKEQTFIQAVLSTGQYASSQDWFWIGGTDRNREGGWEWSRSAPFRYVNWYPGEPNSYQGGEDCMEIVPMWGYQWNDKKCNTMNNYICEKDALPESTVSPPVSQPTVETGTCKPEPMISGVYSLPYGQGALQVSSQRDSNHGPEHSRMTSAAWSSSTNNQGQWISATFYNIIITKGIRIQGRRDTNEWVKQFKLQYQYDYFSPWYTYQDPPGTDKVFQANSNSYTSKDVSLNFAIEAKSIKLIPVSWQSGISLKWDILGCIEEDCYADYGVSGPLFVQDGGFSSSTIFDPQHSPHDARTHSNGPNYVPSCWKPSKTDTTPWLEINLGSVKVVRGVTTKGNPAAPEWVTQYQVSYKLADGTSTYYQYQQPYNTIYMFSGNTDNHTAVTHMMKSHFQAQVVRITVMKFHTAAALRVDLLVCPITCREIPLINGPEKVSDSQLSSSSSLNSEHGPQRSRLNQPAQGDYIGAWEAEYNDNKQYIQVDLGRVVEVTAVATQGRDDQNQFVRAYTLSSSTDSIHWYPYFEGRSVRTFDGNWDSKTVRKHYFMIPQNVQYVRLWPTDWQDRISLRWELYGCPGPMSGSAIGCYADSKTDRDLPYEPLTDPNAGIWPPSCIHHCYLKGYFYAGLQNGFECYCGNDYGKYGPGVNCSMPCFPHPNMKCGGPNANYIHSTGLSFEKVCQQGWKSYKDDCFLLLNDMRSWSDARLQCKKLGADLASINDQTQQDFLYSLMTKGGDDVWIGLNDHQELMFYEWANERPVKYTNWDLNEPSNVPGKNEDCVKVNFKTGGWQDEVCDNRHKYVCIAAKIPTTMPTMTPAVQGCEQGWKGFRWSCYLYIQEVRSWQNAYKVCTSMGATLIRIDDRYEQAYIGSVLSTMKNSYWSDVTDSKSTGTFMYSDGRTLAPYTNWAKDKPDTSGQCVSLGTGLNTGLWSNVACNSTLSAICERMRSGYTLPATLPPTAPPVPCPAGWVEETGYCYQINSNPINQQISWADAKKDCQKQRASLASFHNSTALDDLWRNHIVGANDHFWIGLNIMEGGGKGGYQWSDKSPVDMTMWGTGEPNNQGGGEQCVELRVQTGTFNDQACWNMRNWICGIRKGQQIMKRTTMQPPTAGKPGSCGPARLNWQLYNNHCYMVQGGEGDKGKTWREARKACIASGGDLASIGSIMEQLFVQKLVSNVSDVHVWIGFNELDWEYGYRWSDGTPTKFIYWNTNEPNDFKGSESCGDMTVYNGKWNDEHCSSRRGYVCKANNGPPTPPVTQPSVMPGYCPSGFSTFGNRCFKVYNNAVDWAQARKICKGQGRGFDLATIQNAREQAFATTLLMNSQHDLWLGLYKAQLDYGIELRWAFNDDPLQFTAWDQGEPNGQMKEGCVHMIGQRNKAGKWNDNDCKTPMGFLCETLRKPYIQHPEAIPNPCNANQGWTPLGTDCFKLVTTPKSWSDASSNCLSQGAALTSITTLYEQAYVYLLASAKGSTSPVWIGLNDVKKQGKYVWTDDWPVVFTNWNDTEPSKGPNEGCVTFDAKSGFWSDDVCSKTMGYVCRISSAQPSFTPAPPNGQCPGDNWEAFGSSCYRFRSNEVLKYADAVFQCEEIRANLASIHDNTTNQYLVSRVSLQTSFGIWIGLRRSQDAGFSWRDTSPVDYDNWMSGEPSKTDSSGTPETCVELLAQTGLWNDVACTTPKGYVCVRPQVHDANVKTFPTIPKDGTPVPPTLPAQEVPTPKQNIPPSPKMTTKTTTTTTTTTSTTTYKAPTKGPILTPKPHTFPTPVTQAPVTVPVNQHSSPALIVDIGKPGVSGGGIAAIVLGVVIALIIAVVVTVLIMKKRQEGYNTFNDTSKGPNSFSNELYEKHHGSDSTI